ncbi:MAG: gliding motility-associated C-terminal domain-containing protein [Bacteroidales bacterium]|nr:gliding motility-associated C-terminal domain-containing protein [Bacteroidales bacterium]
MEERNHLFQSLRQYSPQPPQQVWKKIEHQMDVSNKKTMSGSKKWIIGVAVGLIVGVIVGLWLLLPKTPKTTTISSVNVVETKKEIVLDSVFTAPSTINDVTPAVSAPIVVDEQRSNSSTPLNVSPQQVQTIIEKSENITDNSHQEIKQNVVATESKPEKNTHNDKTEQPSIIDSTETILETHIQEDTIAKSVLPIFVELNQHQNICRGEKATLRLPQGNNIVWSNGATTNNITVNPLETTTYQVTWEQNHQCYQSEMTISVLDCALFIPNAFSPNGDGINDIFRPVGEGISNFNMLIFSSNGERLFESKDIFMGWDGKSGGSLSKAGVYIYRISFQDITGQQRQLQGILNLLP